jgi:Ran GTPase-activating protein (RanGAP) involved in mRNA processing and transport
MTRVPLATRRSGIVLLGLVAATVCYWQCVRLGTDRRAQERTRVERHPEETCSGDGWCIQKLVQGDRKALLALWAASANDVWAVGDTVAHWDGVRWSERKGILGHDLATDERRLSVIHGTATTAFWAFGRGWSLFWDGTQPRQRSAPFDEPVSSAHGTAPDDVWAVSESGATAHWDGQKWSEVPTPSKLALLSVFCAHRNACWAAGGERGPLTATREPNVSGTILYWDGRQWNPKQLPERVVVRGLSGTAGYDVWAVGNRGRILHYDGRQWKRSRARANGTLYAVWATAGDDVWATGEEGIVLHYDGRGWSAAWPTGQSIRTMTGTQSREFWALASGGSILHWHGATYRPKPVPPARLWGPDEEPPTRPAVPAEVVRDIRDTECGKYLAELVRMAPSPEVFDAVVQAVRGEPCDGSRPSAIAQADRDLATWPDEARRVSVSSEPATAKEDIVVWRLARHIEAEFTSLDDDCISRLQWPHFARLTSLDVSFDASGGQCSGDRGAAIIASSAALSGLHALRIGNSGLTDKGAIAIAASRTLKSLTKLSLDENSIGDRGARAIGQSRALTHLTALDLRHNEIGEAGARAIAESASLTCLTALLLGRNFLGPEGARAIAASRSFGGLKVLDLSFNLVGPGGAQALFGSGPGSSLTELSLTYNLLGNDGARAIASVTNMPSLARLDLSYNEIGDESAELLGMSKLPPDLKLDLTHNPIGEAAEEAIRAVRPTAEFDQDPSSAGINERGFVFASPLGEQSVRSGLPPPPGFPRDVQYRRFVNVRFAFAVDFPTFLVPSDAPPNGDGRAFHWRRGATLLAFGSWDEGSPIERVYRERLKEAGNTAGGSLRGNSFAISSMKGSYIIRETRILKDGRWAIVIIQYDRTMRAYFAPIARRIQDSLRTLGPPG